MYTEFFDGSIDNVRINRAALSSSQLSADRNTAISSSGGTPPPPPPVPANTAPPAISGTAADGSTLTASTGTWTNSPTSYTYTWDQCNASGTGCAATTVSGNTYDVTAPDNGDTIEVTVTATNANGSAKSTSTPTAVVPSPAAPPPSNPAPANTAAPSISGTPADGYTLTAGNGTWTNSPTSYTYTWDQCNASGTGCTPTTVAGNTYDVTSPDNGDTIEVTVTATNAGGSANATSAPTAVVPGGGAAPPPTPAPANTTPPTVSGTPVQGNTLSASNGTWSGSPTGYIYQWQDCNSSGGSCVSIAGATSSTYTLQASDVGYTLVAVVTASNAGGNTPASSAAVGPVTAAGGGAPPPGGSSCTSGTCYYVRAGATGNGSGSDWTNACPGFTGSCAPSALVRGATYYVAAGSYGSYHFNTPASGTQTITIKGATSSDHGTSTGWAAGYAVGTGGNQATFGYPLDFTGAQYITFDGNTACGSSGGPVCSDTSTYGFTVATGGCGTSQENEINWGDGSASTVSHDIWAHIAMTACATSYDQGKSAMGEYSPQSVLSNLTFEYDACVNFQECIGLDATGTSTYFSNFTLDHLYVTGGWGSSSNHGEVINIRDHIQNVTLSNSFFGPDTPGAGLTGTVIANDAAQDSSPNPPCVSGFVVYGNVFDGSNAGEGNNGVISSTTRCAIQNAQIYNNTFYNNGSFWFAACFNGGNCGSATNNVVENNVVYGEDATIGSGVTTSDYNSYFNDTNAPSEAHGQVSSSNPFVNASGGNFELSSDTSVWNATGMPGGDGVDQNGVTRTSSRGALQFH
jgi:hypothetical protein